MTRRFFRSITLVLISLCLTNSNTFAQEDWKNKPMPAFSHTDLQGRMVNLAKLKDTLVVVNYWFIACKPCVAEMPELNRLVEKYKGHPVRFLAPTLDEKSALVPFFKTRKFDYTILPDAQSMMTQLNIVAYPTSLIVDKKGVIREILVGGATDMYNKLDRLIQQQLKAAGN